MWIKARSDSIFANNLASNYERKIIKSKVLIIINYIYGMQYDLYRGILIDDAIEYNELAIGKIIYRKKFNY